MASITRGGGLMGWAAAALVVAAGCAPPEGREPGERPGAEEPQQAAAGRPIETDDGLYLLTFTRPEGDNFPWPTNPGPTRMNVTVAAGPEFPSAEDKDLGLDKATPAYPLKLDFDAVTPPESSIGMSFFPEAWATRSDGTAWTVRVDFTGPGEWVMPVTVADIDGHIDRVRVAFTVQGKPGEGKPVMFR
ncbi:hypothetical protein [Nannocystis sp. SCPEA4]|uniref:hypothetical protein n=1 Tax=Nannocystis sp. SCPEA4 TaxID=2996787 RepID=UPI00226E3E14|nr:hypothetical protein [Nannocystis sp. SCPEA4]